MWCQLCGLSVFLSWLSSSCWFLPWTSTSSFMSLCLASLASVMYYWHISLADEILNGRRVNWCILNGMMKIIRVQDVGESGFCYWCLTCSNSLLPLAVHIGCQPLVAHETCISHTCLVISVYTYPDLSLRFGTTTLRESPFCNISQLGYLPVSLSKG